MPLFDWPKNASDLVKSYCLVDHEYPVYEIQHAVEYHYSAVAALYKARWITFEFGGLFGAPVHW